MAESNPTESSFKIPPWLKTLPLAPTYYPTLSEFQDPISYIYKIEKEASLYGICKIVPPLVSASKKTVITNFNRSLGVQSKTPSKDSKTQPTFTTFCQQVGFSPKNETVIKQSGEKYSFKEFEAKAKSFEKTHFKRFGKKSLLVLEIESLYWNGLVDTDTSFCVEYANDISGSAFAPINGKKLREVGEAETVADTAWNMRGVSRAKGSLLRFMKEDVPGVTTPVIDVSMLFSWFAWHVEEHDLHSLNYIHTGASKTWYGVPKEVATAFEEVVNLHGHGGEGNPIVTCGNLAEKTTMMSPEVFIDAGVPCCRLVQNAGEFVVTFPRAYHCGISHGFSCGESANIATPDWLVIAKEAAVRRASINRPPILSHLELLYALSLSLYSRIPLSISTEPRSSRIKEKKRTEGETIIKELFVKDAIQKNKLLDVLLEQGSSCVLLRQNSRFSHSIWNPGEAVESLETSVANDVLLYRNSLDRRRNRVKTMRQCSRYLCEGNTTPSFSMKHHHSSSKVQDAVTEKGSASQSDGILNHGMFSCVRCGILSFPCAAVIHPQEEAIRFFATFECNYFLDQFDAFGAVDDKCTDADQPADTLELNRCSGRLEKRDHDKAQKGISSLDLLASCYGDPSDSEDEKGETEIPVSDDEDYTTNNQRYRCGSPDEDFSSVSNFTSHSTIPFNPGHSDEEARIFHSSTKHIFCLEHAVEVEKQLRKVGGANVLLVCHPDYPKVETEVKALAAELEINYQWKDTFLREATKDDRARIQSALNVKAADPRTADWTVKLEINLSHIAKLSQSPRYNKLIAYDSVISNAFGCSSSIAPSVKPKVSAKRTGKHGKVVIAGKWCGKVWMSNQVHPYLAQRIGSKAESFNSQPTRELKVTVESESRPIDQTEELLSNEKPSQNMTITRKSERKRKGTSERGVTKKPKCSPVDNPPEAVEDSSAHSSPPHFGMILRSSRKKQNVSALCTKREKKEEVASGPDTRPRKKLSELLKSLDAKSASKKETRKKNGKKTCNKYTTVNDEGAKYKCDLRGCDMEVSSKQELDRHKRNICLVQGCGKKFHSHEYLGTHMRVHKDDRPLKCPWKGCKRAFKWAWARTEHIRVHTGDRPYECQEPGCNQTFRFVTDFSRHRRKTGHSVREKVD